ncbi:MAG: DUF167 family protein [Sulfuricaulis sp.]
MGWFRREGPDILLQVQVLPRGRADAIAGIIGNYLKIRISAPPVDGRANLHLIVYLAKLFGVPKKNVVLERGESAKHKLLRIRSPRKLPDIFRQDPG